MNIQEEEIRTIKERTITLKLSDADVTKFCNKAGAVGLSISELVENFIGDLVCGTYSNGSDERMVANDWFNRCWFGMFPEDTLLRYLIDTMYYDPNDFIELLDNIADITNDIKILDNKLIEFGETDDEEMDLNMISRLITLKLDLEDNNSEYHEIIDSYIDEHPEIDISVEIEKIKEWLIERNKFVGEDI